MIDKTFEKIKAAMIRKLCEKKLVAKEEIEEPPVRKINRHSDELMSADDFFGPMTI